MTISTERLNNNRWRHREEDEGEDDGEEERDDDNRESYSEGERPPQRRGDVRG